MTTSNAPTDLTSTRTLCNRISTDIQRISSSISGATLMLGRMLTDFLIRTTADGEVWVLGSSMYSKTDLDAQVQNQLLHIFDADRELIEGTNTGEWLLAEVVMFRRVVSSRELAEKEGCCHQSAEFVDDDPNKRPRAWKVASPKVRPSSTAMEVGSADDNGAPDSRAARAAKRAKTRR